MIKLGITGGIGSGKSVVSQLLEIMGVPVYISDDQAKRLTAQSPCIRQGLINLLGEEVYQKEQLNKPFLAAYLFSNAEHARKVNDIIHPEVKKDFQRWVRLHAESPIIAMESAILIEAGFSDEVDQTVMVYAPLELRIQRTMKRDAITQAAVAQRIRSQMDDEKKKEMANFVIYNDDQTPLIPQLEKLLEDLSKK